MEVSEPWSRKAEGIRDEVVLMIWLRLASKLGWSRIRKVLAMRFRSEIEYWFALATPAASCVMKMVVMGEEDGLTWLRSNRSMTTEGFEAYDRAW